MDKKFDYMVSELEDLSISCISGHDEFRHVSESLLFGSENNLNERNFSNKCNEARINIRNFW